MELPFVYEACIVSIPDKDSSTRVAALVRFHQDFSTGNLVTVRKYLSEKLLHYKLPTALRVLKNGEEIPLTISGKIMRKRVVEQYFPITGYCQLPADVELWNIHDDQKSSGPRKAWDWAGLQGC